MDHDLLPIAGFISTALFTVGTLPMLVKTFQTKNLASYSLGNILMSNVGNLVHSFYVFSLPPGPVWFLHSYNLASTALMLVWYLRYEARPHSPQPMGHQATLRVPPALCCSPAPC